MRRRTFLLTTASALAALPLYRGSALADPQSWDNPDDPPADRAERLLAEMSTTQQAELVCCDFEAVAELGIPPLAMADASAGIRGETGVTAFPVPLAQAAAFDPAPLEELGAAIAREGRGKGFNTLLAPTLDPIRLWRWGRSPEAMGEDPLLAGELGARVAAGMRAEHTVTTLKHVAAYAQELDRLTVDVAVSRRALYETYYRPFERVIRELPETAVMTSYPRINGDYASQNPELLADLKGGIGLTGYTVPDFQAGDNQIAAAKAGTDLAGLGPDGVQITPDELKAEVAEERIRDAARRILVTMFAGGLFDHPLGDPEEVVTTQDHQDLAYNLAVQGTVLLANRDALPVGGSVGSIAVIGPAGEDAISGVEGSSYVDPGEWVTPLRAIRDRAGESVSVRHEQGSRGDVPLDAIPESALVGPDDEAGLQGTYYAGPDLAGEPVATARAATLDFDADPVDGLPEVWSARWSGRLRPQATGLCRFSLLTAGYARLVIDGDTVIEGTRASTDFMFGPYSYALQGTVELTEAREVEVAVEYTNQGTFLGAVALHLGWQPESTISAAAEAAGDADVAVVLVNRVAGENMDHVDLALPGDQNTLVSAVAAENPNTVVVLNTDGPVAMPWLDDVAAVLQVWYGGVGMGTALADILFGDVEPAGRLPVTFPASEDQGPGTTPQTYPGVDGTVDHAEGPDIGYRFYQRHDQQPLFSFGHGLGYTTFSYGNLGVHNDGAAQELVVEANVENTGDRAGHEVAQLYVGLPESSDSAPKQLAGFHKTHLEPGERERVEWRVPFADLSVWDDSADEWRLVSGRYDVHVGRSAADTPLHRTISLG